MIDEGVIKFNCNWEDNDLPINVPVQLMEWRDKMHELNLIGEYKDIQIGFGNISIITPLGILISGTQTGNIYPIKEKDFALATSYNMAKNSLNCVGRIKASAESLTHAAFYEADEAIKAVIHIHNKEMWDALIDKIPTSKREVSYGTSEMASEIKRLFQDTDIQTQKIMVMGGHDEGIIAFGKNLQEAGQVVLNVLTQFN